MNQYRIIYEVYNEGLFKSKLENGNIDKKIHKSVLKFRLGINKDPEVSLPFPIPKGNRIHYKDTLKVTVNNQIKINGEEVSNTVLVEKFKKHINKETLFLYSFNDDTKYQDYIMVLSSHYKATYILRENEQTVFKENRYDRSKDYRNEQNKLKLKFPIQIIEDLD